MNANIGAPIEGNKTQVTKGVRQLLQLANKKKMTLNTVKEKCKGECVKLQREEKISNWLCSDKFNKWWHSKGNKNRWRKTIWIT